jgi:hypothetical protein
MKNLETFFELSNYDSKNITNKGDKVIPQEQLDKIESEGVTLEFLQQMGVPIFKYKTQITIHGTFPTLTNNYLGGYKNLFQNKNLSIGVKWQVVDYAKKNKIYSTVRGYLKGWRTEHNSTDFYIYKTSDTFTDRETYKTKLEQAKQDIAHIDRNLFFGNCGVYLSQTLWGGYFLVSYINIGAILETNVDSCIENICQATLLTISQDKARKEELRQREEQERKLEYEKQIAEKKAKQAPIFEDARKILVDNGYVLEEKTPITNGKIYITIQADTETGRFNFVATRYTKEGKQRKFRYQKQDSENLEFTWQSNLYNQETIRETATGWVKATTVTPQPKREQPKQTPPTVAGNIEVIKYSEKAIGIFGDTKPIKDSIKAIGGKFNAYLNYNGGKAAGWILPLTKLEQVQRLIG